MTPKTKIANTVRIRREMTEMVADSEYEAGAVARRIKQVMDRFVGRGDQEEALAALAAVGITYSGTRA